MGGAEDSLQTAQNFLVIPLLVRSEFAFQPLYFCYRAFSHNTTIIIQVAGELN
jgi:hypothetical protein